MKDCALIGPRLVGAVLVSLLSGIQSGHTETVTGTGFAVTSDGVVITNYHVINECDSTIRARIEGSPEYYYVATVAARDASRDLAALRLLRGGQSAQGPIRGIPRVVFRKGPAVQQGEKAITYGFPLRGLLATSGNLTSGYVSALSGLGDDPNYIQIATPVQQGNSGGPLYDGSGHVIGVVVAKLNALRVMLATGDVPQNVNFAVEIGAVRHFLQQNKVQVAEEDSTNELPLPEIAQKARLSTYLIECETQDALVSAPSMLAPPPASPKYTGVPTPPSAERQQPIPVDLSKLKFSDIRRPYPYGSPQIVEIAISNAASDRVSELTVAFRRTQGQPCSRNLEEYDGFKRFSVDLLPGDSVTVTGEFSAQAVSFCIVRAVGPPVGLTACSNSTVAADVAITACTNAIRSGDVHGAGLTAAYASRGNRYDRKGDYDRAIADYTEAIRLNPKLDYAFFRRGWAYAKKNEHDRAIADCSQAISLNPRSEGALYVRAYSSVRKGDYDQGIADYSAVITLNAGNSGAFHGRANLYLRKDDFDRAIADYTEAIKLEPNLTETVGLNLSDALRSRGLNYDRRGEYDRAIADYSEAIRLNPNLTLPYLTRRGYAYHAKGDYERAITDYDEAIRINPNYVVAYHNRGFAHFAKGEYHRAIVDYTEAIRLNQKYATSYRNRGIAQLYSGSRAKAQADLEVATQLMPKDAYLALWREIAARQANAPSTLAQAVSQIDMASWPGPIARFLLGEGTQAALFASAKDSDPKKSRERLCEANFFVGQFALQRGSKEEAKRAFQIAARDCPRQFLERGAAAADLRALNSK
jgi:tetratricopeptide (TPR) repeat protein